MDGQTVATFHIHTWQQLTKASQSDCLHGQGAQGLDGAITMGNGKWTRTLRFVLDFFVAAMLMCVHRSTSAMIPTRHSRATAAVP